jgi:hypothetical protein
MSFARLSRCSQSLIGLTFLLWATSLQPFISRPKHPVNISFSSLYRFVCLGHYWTRLACEVSIKGRSQVVDETYHYWTPVQSGYTVFHHPTWARSIIMPMRHLTLICPYIVRDGDKKWDDAAMLHMFLKAWPPMGWTSLNHANNHELCYLVQKPTIY